MKKQQAGFTLIELIIVIVILGILAVTAAPRFIDIQSEARTETLNGVKGALQSSAQLVFAKAAIAGRQNLAGTDGSANVDVNGNPVQIHFGYPDGWSYTQIDTTSGPTVYGIDTFLDIDDSQLALVRAGTDETDAILYITFNGETAPANGCYVRYDNASASGSVPNIQVVSTGC